MHKLLSQDSTQHPSTKTKSSKLLQNNLLCSLNILTVAGEATSRSIGSKIKFVVGESWMISPDIKQSFLLSSRTVFMFSIQIASTGPSNINHFLFKREKASLHDEESKIQHHSDCCDKSY